MSQSVSELCLLLVEDLYGELTSRILEVLFRYGRLPIAAIRAHTRLSPRLIKHGLAVLLQQQLVYGHTPSAEVSIYEVNTVGICNLIRSGKYIRVTKDRLGDFASGVISNLLLLGHARVRDLVQAYGVSSELKTLASGKGVTKTAGKSLLNGVSKEIYSDQGDLIGLETIHDALCNLLQAGFVSHVNESHFRSDADNRIEAERTVPSPETYKAKSKRDRDAQWEGAIQSKLEEWKYGSEAEKKDLEILRNGKKRPLEEADSLRAQKRRRLNGDMHIVSDLTQASHSEKKRFLDNDLVLRVNHAKFSVIMRNACLVRLAEKSICVSTSRVYARVLSQLEPNLRVCKEESLDTEALDEDPEFNGLAPVSTEEVVDAIGDTPELWNDLGQVDASRLDDFEEDHPKKRRRKEEKNDENKVMVDGDASADEVEEEKEEIEKEDSTHSVSSAASDDINGEAEHLPQKAPPKAPDPKHEAVRNHLLLLTRHPHRFLHHFPETLMSPERWTVCYSPLVDTLQHQTIYEIVTARYGMAAARIIRLLVDKGKMDEKFMQNLILTNQKTMRCYLTTLHGASLIYLQDIPRDNSRNPQRTLFAWYFDLERARRKLVNETYKSMARCLQRLKVEKDKVKGTIEKATRSDVIGREEELLTPQELEALMMWREKEEKILGEVGRLDELVGVFRDY